MVNSERQPYVEGFDYNPIVESYSIASLDKTEVLRYMGHRGQSYSQDIDRRIDESINRCLEVARPKGCIRIFNILPSSQLESGVRLDNCALVLQGRDIAKHLDGAVAVGLMAVTLSMSVDRELRLLSHTDPLGEVMFDAAATAAIEQAADAAEARIVERALEHGLHANWRFSPGYGDLPLDCQEVLLSSLNAQRLIGLTTTNTHLLIPTKSVTAIVGLFETPQPSAHNGCATCNCRNYCSVRKTGRNCHE